MTAKAYEVVIVGGGPAGTVSAAYLAKAGFSVAIIDKCTFPRHKTCGDFIPPFAVPFLQEWNFWSKIPMQDRYAVKAAEICYFGKELPRIRFNSENPEANSVIISRYHFDNALFDTAMEQGAVFMHGQAVDVLRSGDAVVGVRVATKDGPKEIAGRVVIAADGSNSKLASLLNPHNEHRAGRAFAMRAYIDHFAVKSNTVEAFFRKEFWPGYAWIFPVSETKVNVGLGYLDQKSCQHTNLKRVFQDFITSSLISSRMNENSRILDMRAKLLNLGFDRNYQRAFNGAVLVGDAADLVNPLTGGGICNAMVSGKLAAETIIKAFSVNDVSQKVLSEYATKLTKISQKDYLYSEYLARFFYAAPQGVIRLLSLSFKKGPLPLILQKMYPDVQIS